MSVRETFVVGSILKRFRKIVFLPLALMLGGCNAVVLSPSGDIAIQQRDILVESTALMLLIVIPVMILTAVIAWRYRESNASARNDPDWDHSTRLELVIWSVPLLIVICIGAITWASTHLLDPFRPLERISADRPLPQDTKSLNVEVVALDWKWLFIYPDYGIATVNEMAAPVDQPIHFRITASSVMNSFYIPALAGQIYAMPGMQTQLRAVMNAAGKYEGFSANYSGAGFSGMRFSFLGVTQADFDKWVASAKASGMTLDRNAYLALERPSENEPVRRYAGVDATLFTAIINMCVEPGKMCMREMAAIDAKGGLGLASAKNILPLSYDKYARRGAVFGMEPSYVAGLCAIPESPDELANATPVPQLNASRLVGAGLPLPSLKNPSAPPLSLISFSRPPITPQTMPSP